MKTPAFIKQSPAVVLTIERAVGKGYQVTTTDGPCDDALKARALALLDDIGQPNPKGPSETYHWFQTTDSPERHVGVRVSVLDNGESRYQQSWYAPSGTNPPKSRPAIDVFLAVALLAAGAAIGYSVGSNKDIPPRDSIPPTVKKQPGDPTPIDEQVKRLALQAVSSKEVSKKLKDYLSQDGFAAKTGVPVVEEKRSVKLIADFDGPLPERESIRLNNIDVRKLIDLFDAVEEWQAARLKDTGKS